MELYIYFSLSFSLPFFLCGLGSIRSHRINTFHQQAALPQDVSTVCLVLGLSLHPEISTQKGEEVAGVQQPPLTLIYIKADELLYTFSVLKLCGAVVGILTWVTEGALGFPHFFVHSSQTQPRGGGDRRTYMKVLDSAKTLPGPLSFLPQHS